jgi:rhodanese-related sulfurtransferase
MASQLPGLVGLIARKEAGKDTAAEVLLEQGYQNVKFAGALKDMIRCVLAYQGADDTTIERMIEGDLKEVPTDYLAGKTPRFAMQTLGTEWGRNLIGENFWVGAAIARAVGQPTVITDVRFPNEVDAVHEAGGVAIGIEADWIVPTEGEHESEAAIDGLIAALPASQKVFNRKGKAGEIRKAIQEFQARFQQILSSL